MKIFTRFYSLGYFPSWLTLLSGLCLIFSFAPINIYPLIWVCLIPWFFALEKYQNLYSWKAYLAQGFWLSYFMSLGCFFWVASALQEFGNIPWIICLFLLQIFCFFGQPQFIFFSLIFFKVITKSNSFSLKNDRINKEPNKKTIFLLACLYVGVEQICPKVFQDSIGHSLYLSTHIRQAADLGGVPLLTFIIVLINLSLFFLLKEIIVHKKVLMKTIFHPERTLAFVLVLLFWIYGFYRISEIQEIVSKEKSGIQIAAIQANIGDVDKISAEKGIRRAVNHVMDTFISISEEALQLTPKPDIIVWPETAYPSIYGYPIHALNKELDNQINNFLDKIQIPILFGGYDHVFNKEFNAFIFLEPSLKTQVYHKNKLLLFGEYIPGADQFSWIKENFPQVGNFGRGTGAKVFQIPFNNSSYSSTIKIGPIICYEVLFSDYVLEAANQGSQLILNITNDSWFGEWSEPYLHLALSTFRSIETRLPMIRSTNTGFSVYVHPDGTITQSTSLNKAEILNVFVPILDPIPTLIKKWGNWFSFLSTSISFVYLILFLLRKKFMFLNKC